MSRYSLVDGHVYVEKPRLLQEAGASAVSQVHVSPSVVQVQQGLQAVTWLVIQIFSPMLLALTLVTCLLGISIHGYPPSSLLFFRPRHNLDRTNQMLVQLSGEDLDKKCDILRHICHKGEALTSPIKIKMG